MLRAAVAAVRQGSEPASEPAPNAPAAGDPDDEERPTDPAGLSEAVARELAAATARLPIAQREALALRELLGLGYAEIAAATDSGPRGRVPLLLAQARLDLRTQLRGAGAPQPPCDERERALRTIARRQDGEGVLGRRRRLADRAPGPLPRLPVRPTRRCWRRRSATAPGP